MILHLPHSSDIIPDRLRDQITLSDDDLAAELLRLTDAFTDKLFVFPAATKVRFPMSRLLLDVERFPEDSNEPMSNVGMGMIYTRTAYGEELRRALQPEEKSILLEYYEKHHEILSNEVTKELDKYGRALIVDCHSFPSQPLPCDMDQGTPRPDFCIGTDSFHTPLELIRMSGVSLGKMGYDVGIDRPYAGTLVPAVFYGKDNRVVSIMIEIKRNLYMDELTGRKKNSFEIIKEHITTLLCSINRL